MAVEWAVGQEMVLVKEDIGSVNNFDLLAWKQVDEQWFFLEDNATNRDLWVTDGTEEGTERLLEDSAFALSARPHLYMGNYQGMCYFAGKDEEHGIEVWRSDGTKEGTQFFAELAEGTENSHPAGFVEFNGQLYIWAYIKKEDGTTFSQLWRTDGTNIEMIKEISVCENTFFDYEFTLQEFTVTQDAILFTLGAEFGGTQFCLWKTDGTSEGTVIVTETDSDGPGGLITADNNTSYFVAIEQLGGFLSNFLWRSDGTTSGTFAIESAYKTRNRTVVGNSLYFVRFPGFGSTDYEIFKTEGDVPTLVTSVPAEGAYLYSDLTEFDNKLFFVFEDEEHGIELWVSDGSESGTRIFEDVNIGMGNSQPRYLTVIGDYLYFIANYDEENFGLYQMEVIGGEGVVKQMVDFATIDVEDIRELVAFGEDLFVITNNANNRSQLWIFNNPLIDNIEENNSIESIKVSPNPFEQETLLSFPKPISNGVLLKVYNPLGQQVEISY
ncbi:MAG: hypothetical protein AB8B69_10625, partial [Chitinophagales bacterium]